jgi:hypothetical protein
VGGFVGGDGDAGGDAASGGGGVLRIGEGSISSSHTSSLRSSTSHRRFLVRFAGGGDNGGDVLGVGCGVGGGAGESCFGGGAGCAGRISLDVAASAGGGT